MVCSTESDLHSSIVGAIGALKGRLHGGANEKVMEILQEAGGPESADRWVRDALARRQRIMGFGHRVYKTGDERARILKAYARRAAEAAGDALGRDRGHYRDRGGGREGAASEPRLAGRATVPRSETGDSAVHADLRDVAGGGLGGDVIEQLEHNRLIRPRGHYIGPERRSVTPLAERS